MGRIKDLLEGIILPGDKWLRQKFVDEFCRIADEAKGSFDLVDKLNQLLKPYKVDILTTYDWTNKLGVGEGSYDFEYKMLAVKVSTSILDRYKQFGREVPEYMLGVILHELVHKHQNQVVDDKLGMATYMDRLNTQWMKIRGTKNADFKVTKTEELSAYALNFAKEIYNKYGDEVISNSKLLSKAIADDLQSSFTIKRVKDTFGENSSEYQKFLTYVFKYIEKFKEDKGE